MAEESGVKVPEEGILVGIEPKEMITSIVLGPYLSDKEKADTLSQLEEHELQHLVRYSSQLLHPVFI